MGFLITLWYMHTYVLFTPSQTLSCLPNPQPQTTPVFLCLWGLQCLLPWAKVSASLHTRFPKVRSCPDFSIMTP